MVNYAERLLSAFGVAEHTEREMSEEECAGIGIDPTRADSIKEEILQVAEQAKQLAAAS